MAPQSTVFYFQNLALKRVFSRGRSNRSLPQDPSSSDIMVNKRKRDESSDSDPDEVAPGRQILPVANLPHNFDQVPQDGMQYLFLVRRDARRLPHVTRVRNPYEVSETKVAHTFIPSSTNVLPCEGWRIAFQTHFSNLRKNLTQATIRVGHDHPGLKRVVPQKKDRDAWWKFLAGHPESAWSPKARSVRKKLSTSYRAPASADPAEAVFFGDATSYPDMQSRDESSHLPIACLDLPQSVPRRPSVLGFLPSAESTNAAPFAVDLSIPSEEAHEQLSPPEVTPSHLKEIDHRLSIHLLMYFTHWINVHLQDLNDPLTTISVSHGRWIFALLTKIEDQLSADEMNLLRNLARACLGLIQRYRGKHAEENAVFEGGTSPVPVENTTRMSDASCWMVFAAVAGHWGQRDLWVDAETTLAGA